MAAICWEPTMHFHELPHSLHTPPFLSPYMTGWFSFVGMRQVIWIWLLGSLLVQWAWASSSCLCFHPHDGDTYVTSFTRAAVKVMWNEGGDQHVRYHYSYFTGNQNTFEVLRNLVKVTQVIRASNQIHVLIFRPQVPCSVSSPPPSCGSL